MILIVTYDLHNPTRKYDDLIASLKKATSWAHPQGSVWLLDTLEGVGTWRDRLKAHVDSNDEIFVARLVGREWASYNMDADVVAWLNSTARRW